MAKSKFLAILSCHTPVKLRPYLLERDKVFQKGNCLTPTLQNHSWLVARHHQGIEERPICAAMEPFCYIGKCPFPYEHHILKL